jgi:hypothetical protein
VTGSSWQDDVAGAVGKMKSEVRAIVQA